MTQIDSYTVAARDLDIADIINGARITLIRRGPGVVYVWIDDNDRPAADMIFNHGDPVRITRPAEACITCGAALTADDPAVTTLGPRCRRHF